MPAAIPVSFELTILLAAFGAFIGMLALNGLPRFFHPVFRAERFRRVTNDRFFLFVEAGDGEFEFEKTRTFLAGLGGSHLTTVLNTDGEED